MVLTPIQEVHESVYLFLKGSGLPFVVRQRPTEKFEQGYWLLGNSSIAVTSFWEGRDWQNKTPYIYLDINETDFVLNFIANENPEKENKLAELASILGLKQTIRKKNPVPHWRKSYNNELGYIKCLQSFIDTDKKIIDLFVNQPNVRTLFPLIEEKAFQANLQRVEQWRERRLKKETKLTSTNESVDVQQSINKHFMLENLEIENIGHFKNALHKFNFKFNKRITCIIGENGTGKSTILKSIAAAIATYDRNDNSPKINKPLKYLLKMKGISNEGKPLYEEKGSIKLNYRDVSTNKIHSNGLIFDRNGNNFIIDDPNCDFEINKDQNYKMLIIGFSQARGNNSNENQNGNDNYTLESPNFEDIAHLITNESNESLEGLEAWLMKLRAEGFEKQNKGNSDLKEFKIIDYIFELVNKIIALSDETLNHEAAKIAYTHFYPKAGVIAIKIDNQEVPFSIMSQGFNNVFLWVGNLIKRLSEVYKNSGDFRNEPCICLIDEIDTYLHPNWQYSILNILCDYFPKTQFIITTHSPFVLGSVKKEDITIYQVIKEQNDVIVEEIEDNLYGASMEYLTTLMRSTKRFPKVSKDINAYLKLIRQNKIEEAEMVKLELSDINPTDPDLIKGEILIKNKRGY